MPSAHQPNSNLPPKSDRPNGNPAQLSDIALRSLFDHGYVDIVRFPVTLKQVNGETRCCLPFVAALPNQDDSYFGFGVFVDGEKEPRFLGSEKDPVPLMSYIRCAEILHFSKDIGDSTLSELARHAGLRWSEDKITFSFWDAIDPTQISLAWKPRLNLDLNAALSHWTGEGYDVDICEVLEVISNNPQSFPAEVHQQIAQTAVDKCLEYGLRRDLRVLYLRASYELTQLDEDPLEAAGVVSNKPVSIFPPGDLSGSLDLSVSEFRIDRDECDPLILLDERSGSVTVEASQGPIAGFQDAFEKFCPQVTESLFNCIDQVALLMRDSAGDFAALADLNLMVVKMEELAQARLDLEAQSALFAIRVGALFKVNDLLSVLPSAADQQLSRLGVENFTELSAQIYDSVSRCYHFFNSTAYAQMKGFFRLGNYATWLDAALAPQKQAL